MYWQSELSSLAKEANWANLRSSPYFRKYKILINKLNTKTNKK